MWACRPYREAVQVKPEECSGRGRMPLACRKHQKCSVHGLQHFHNGGCAGPLRFRWRLVYTLQGGTRSSTA